MRSIILPDTGIRLRYHDLPGSDPPLIFLHGLGCASSFDYPGIAADPALQGRHAILVDLLGSGFSDQPTGFSYTVIDHARSIVVLLGALGFPEVDLYGHSMGGAIAIDVAVLAHGAIRRLVVSEPNLDPGGGQFSRVIGALTEEAYCKEGHQRTVAEAMAEGNGNWAATLRQSSPEGVHRAAISLIRGGTPTWRESLLALRCPRALLVGEYSPPEPHTDQLRESGVTIRTVPSCGHSMAWENPAGLAQAIRRSLDEEIV